MLFSSLKIFSSTLFISRYISCYHVFVIVIVLRGVKHVKYKRSIIHLKKILMILIFLVTRIYIPYNRIKRIKGL